MNDFYDPFGVPISLLEWARLFEDTEGRIVKQTRHRENGKEFFLSSVYIGIDLNPGHGEPLTYETMAFQLKPPEWNSVIGERDDSGMYATRSANFDETLANHDPWVAATRGW